MKVLCEEQRDLPLVDVKVVVQPGPVADPVGHEGLSRHAAELMRRGAGSRARAELDLALDAIGAAVDVEASQDSVVFSGHCLSRHLPRLLELMGDIVCRPTFPADEHGKLVRESLALLDEIRDDDASLAGRWFERLALSGHPYGRSTLGTETSLKALRREQAVEWARSRLAGERLLVGFAGDVDPSTAERLATQAFGALAPAPGSPLPSIPPAPIGGGRRTYLIDKPERSQSQILIGHGTTPHATKDWLPLHIAATIFGGTFTSRLMTEVRVKRGWSYGAGCRMSRARGGHAFYLRVFPALEQTADTLALVLSLWEEIAKTGVTGEELEFVRGYMDGNWAFDVDTAAKRLDHDLDTHIMGLPADFYAKFQHHLASVTLEDVNHAVRHWWHPEHAVSVVTTTAAELMPSLKGVPLGELQVVPYDQE